jgi:hypothetical protein
MEGRSVVVIAGIGAVISLLSADLLGVVVGTLAAAAGVVILRGVKLLKASQPRGLVWLVRGELGLLNVILIYAAIMLIRLALGGADGMVSADTRSMLASAGLWGPEQKRLFVQSYELTYALVAALSLIFQGGMALYYHRNRAAIHEALAGAKTPAHNPMLATCPACKKEVSIKAEVCPHCGHRLKTSIVNVVAAIILALLIWWCFFGR